MGDLTSSEVLTNHQQDLYLRLQSYCFDAPGGAVTFAAKLACEQGWSAAKSERVLGEYRRFLLLALEAGHPVSPSRTVDLAWHQHLLDTRSYWQEFCPRVLGRPLHHTPSRGGEEERQRLGESYRRTLASYRAFFGEAPPADLWPPAEAPVSVPPAAEAPAAAPRPPRRVPHRWCQPTSKTAPLPTPKSEPPPTRYGASFLDWFRLGWAGGASVCSWFGWLVALVVVCH